MNSPFGAKALQTDKYAGLDVIAIRPQASGLQSFMVDINTPYANSKLSRR